jgi:hypothetical protein
MGRIAGEKRGAECPFCGAIATPVTIGGYDTDNRRIRQRRCEECRHMFVTVETPVMLEDGRPIPYSWLDEHYRHVQREQKRKYHTRKTGSGFRGIKTKPAIEGVATIDVTVKVKVPASMRVYTSMVGVSDESASIPRGPVVPAYSRATGPLRSPGVSR